MAAVAARGIWCHTCGVYIRPGTHGIHEMPFGQGPRGTSPEDPGIGSARAVALVVMLFAGAGFGVLLIVLWAYRALR